MQTLKKYRFPLAFLVIALLLIGGWTTYAQVKSAVAQEPTFELADLSTWWVNRFNGQSQHVMDDNGQIKLESNWDSNQSAFDPDVNGGGTFIFNISETGVVMEGTLGTARKHYDSAEEAFAEMSVAVNAMFSSSRNVHGYDADKYGYRRGGMIIKSSPALTIDEAPKGDAHSVGEAAIEKGFFAVRYWIENKIADDGTAHSYLKFQSNVPIFDGTYEWEVEIEGDEKEIALTKSSNNIVLKANNFFEYFTGVYEKAVLENGVDEMSFEIEIFTSKNLDKSCMKGVDLKEWKRCRTIVPIDIQLLVNGTNAPLPVEWEENVRIVWSSEGVAECIGQGHELVSINGIHTWRGDVGKGGSNDFNIASAGLSAGGVVINPVQISLNCRDTLGNVAIKTVLIPIIESSPPDFPGDENTTEQSQ